MRGVLVLREVVALALPAFVSDTHPKHFCGVELLYAPVMNALASQYDTSTGGVRVSGPRIVRKGRAISRAIFRKEGLYRRSILCKHAQRRSDGCRAKKLGAAAELLPEHIRQPKLHHMFNGALQPSQVGARGTPKLGGHTPLPFCRTLQTCRKPHRGSQPSCPPEW